MPSFSLILSYVCGKKCHSPTYFRVGVCPWSDFQKCKIAGPVVGLIWMSKVSPSHVVMDRMKEDSNICLLSSSLTLPSFLAGFFFSLFWLEVHLYIGGAKLLALGTGILPNLPSLFMLSERWATSTVCVGLQRVHHLSFTSRMELWHCKHPPWVLKLSLDIKYKFIKKPLMTNRPVNISLGPHLFVVFTEYEKSAICGQRWPECVNFCLWCWLLHL